MENPVPETPIRRRYHAISDALRRLRDALFRRERRKARPRPLSRLDLTNEIVLDVAIIGPQALVEPRPGRTHVTAPQPSPPQHLDDQPIQACDELVQQQQQLHDELVLPQRSGPPDTFLDLMPPTPTDEPRPQFQLVTPADPVRRQWRPLPPTPSTSTDGPSSPTETPPSYEAAMADLPKYTRRRVRFNA